MNENHLKKLKDIENLKNKWFFGKGIKIKPETLNFSRELINYCTDRKWNKINLFPGIKGEIEILIYFEETYFEIIFVNDYFDFMYMNRKNTHNILSKERFENFQMLLDELNNYNNQGVFTEK